MQKYFIALFWLIVSSPIFAQSITEDQQVYPQTLSEDDRYGLALGITGDYAIIGAPGDDQYGSNSGAAYVFTYNSGTWSQVDKLISSDIQAGDYFGYTISANGDYLLIGTPITNSYAGAVYVFKNTNGTWLQVQKLTVSDGFSSQLFAHSIDLYGDYAIVGAPGDSTNGENSGAAYIFKNINGTWTQIEKLVPDNGHENDLFGYSVAITDNYAAVGAIGHGDSIRYGAVYIYQNNNDTWNLQRIVISNDPQEGENFGYSVDIDGNRIVVGAPYKNYNGFSWNGAAYLFDNSSGNWQQFLKLLPIDSGVMKYFGKVVNIKDSLIAIAAPGEISFTPHVPGSAYIYNLNTQNMAKFVSSDNTAEDRFGSSLCITDQYFFVGAETSDAYGTDAGNAYYFCAVAPVITQQPQPEITVNEGDDVFISISAQNSLLQYQWLKDGQQLYDGGAISGVNTNTLSIHSVSYEDAGVYTCRVSNLFGEVLSDEANLIVNNGTLDRDISKDDIKIFPNPTKDKIYISGEDIVNVKLFDIMGREIKQVSSNSEKILTIDMKGNAVGIYFLMIETTDGLKVEKVIKK